MSEKLKISVGMTTYNSAKYVREQLESILNQTVLPDEIVICDDHSTDNTVQVLHGVLGNVENISVRIVENERNLGCIKNFEKCFNLCTGDIIISCDADDVWFPNKIERIQEVFLNNQIILAYHDAIVVDADGREIRKSLNAEWDTVDLSADRDLATLRAIRREGAPYGMTMAFKRELLKYSGPFALGHDGWLYLAAILNGDIYRIPEPLAYYRRHGANTSGNNETLIKRVLHTEKTKYFCWPRAMMQSYSDELLQFEDKMPEAARNEIREIMNFFVYLTDVVEEPSKIKAVYKLHKAYRSQYKRFRGNWKMLMVDTVFLLIH